jgi:hypothetical protein
MTVMSDPAARFSTPSGLRCVVFSSGDRVPLVHAVYGKGWDLPGGPPGVVLVSEWWPG